MRTARVLAVAIIVAVVLVCALFSLSAYSTSDAAVKSTTHFDAAFRSGEADAPEDPKGTVDLSGNDVTDAVARYRLDATGSLYEVHSPQTEIPKLGSPKS